MWFREMLAIPLRDNFLIAKKKKGKEKEDKMLSDDEYIGEFVSLIFDCEHKIMMLQANKRYC